MSFVVQFRTEVYAAQRAKTLGTIVVATPHSRWLLTALACAFAAGVLVFGFFAHYTRREAVAGRLLPEEGVVAVQASAAGVLSSVRVATGQRVSKGQVLAVLGQPSATTTLGDSHVATAEQLRREGERLDESLGTVHEQARLQKAALVERIHFLEQQSSAIGQQIAHARGAADDSSAIVERMKTGHAKGFISELQFRQQHATALNDMATIDQLTRQALQVRTDLADAEAKLAQVPVDEANRRSDIEHQQSELAKARVQAEERRATEVVAPTDGVVATSLFENGQAVTAGQTLLTIVPVDARLYAQLLVPSTAVGFTHVGDTVSVRYRAFPYEKYGQYRGRVIDVSRAALSASQLTYVGADSKDTANDAFYVMRVALDQQTVEGDGAIRKLQPDMILDADLYMERRTLLQWIFSPLIGTRRLVDGGRAHG
jgi:membrane fusion protein